MAEQVRGRYTSVTDQEVMNAVYRCTPAGTTEVAELLGVSRQGAEYHLRKLEERDWIWTKKVGPTRVWVHPRVMKQR